MLYMDRGSKIIKKILEDRQGPLGWGRVRSKFPEKHLEETIWEKKGRGSTEKKGGTESEKKEKGCNFSK